MYRARSLPSALVAAFVSAAALAAVVWGGAALAARGTSATALPSLLTTGSFAGLEWPFRTDIPPVRVHVAFWLAVVIVGVLAGLVTAIAVRKASPRNGAAAIFGAWLGTVLGCAVAAAATYFIRVDDLAASAGERNELLQTMLGRFSFGGLALGVLPALLSWVAFKIANRTRRAQYVEAMDLADGKNVDENPFDLAPGSISETRPVEPGFTYPAGDAGHVPSYRDADLPPQERRRTEMTFGDVTDATGEDIADPIDEPAGHDESSVYRDQPEASYDRLDAQPVEHQAYRGPEANLVQPQATEPQVGEHRVEDFRYGASPVDEPELRKTGT